MKCKNYGNVSEECHIVHDAISKERCIRRIITRVKISNILILQKAVKKRNNFMYVVNLSSKTECYFVDILIRI
jgi:hypothetical protein